MSRQEESTAVKESCRSLLWYEERNRQEMAGSRKTEAEKQVRQRRSRQKEVQRGEAEGSVGGQGELNK